jgi:hypothetical protein
MVLFEVTVAWVGFKISLYSTYMYDDKLDFENFLGLYIEIVGFNQEH